MSDDHTSNVRVGNLQVEARARAIRSSMFMVAIVIPLYIFLYQLNPYLNEEATIRRVLSSNEYSVALADAELRGADEYLEYPVTKFVSVAAHIPRIGGVVVKPFPEDARLVIRTDIIILWIGSLVVLLMVIATLVPSLTRLRFGPLNIQLPQSINGAGGSEPASTAALTPVILFAAEVEAAGRRADGFFARSTLLLAGGIVMAFIGVGIFYVTLPDTKPDENLMIYWPKIVRPTGVLIFVEAIAWFLLRQYRALVEDYKWFYRLYLKRANYLAALRILGTDAVRPEDVFVAASLIQEDLSGRLKSGETTESLETLRLPEESPVSEILRLLTTVKNEAKVDKKKPDQENNGG